MNDFTTSRRDQSIVWTVDVRIGLNIELKLQEAAFWISNNKWNIPIFDWFINKRVFLFGSHRLSKVINGMSRLYHLLISEHTQKKMLTVVSRTFLDVCVTYIWTHPPINALATKFMSSLSEAKLAGTMPHYRPASRTNMLWSVGFLMRDSKTFMTAISAKYEVELNNVTII